MVSCVLAPVDTPEAPHRERLCLLVTASPELLSYMEPSWLSHSHNVSLSWDGVRRDASLPRRDGQAPTQLQENGTDNEETVQAICQHRGRKHECPFEVLLGAIVC